MKGFTGKRCEINIDDGGVCSGCYSNDSDKACPASCEWTIISMLNITKTLSNVQMLNIWWNRTGFSCLTLKYMFWLMNNSSSVDMESRFQQKQTKLNTP